MGGKLNERKKKIVSIISLSLVFLIFLIFVRVDYREYTVTELNFNDTYPEPHLNLVCQKIMKRFQVGLKPIHNLIFCEVRGQKTIWFWYPGEIPDIKYIIKPEKGIFLFDNSTAFDEREMLDIRRTGSKVKVVLSQDSFRDFKSAYQKSRKFLIRLDDIDVFSIDKEKISLNDRSNEIIFTVDAHDTARRVESILFASVAIPKVESHKTFMKKRITILVNDKRII